MPSHFHSPEKSPGASLSKSVSSSIGCDSIGGRNGAGFRVVGRGPRPSAQANRVANGGASPCQTSSTASASWPPSAPTAVLASRAETPTRRFPVTSFSSAQRPVSSSASSQVARWPGRSVLLMVDRVSTTSASVGTCGGGLLWPGPGVFPPPTDLRACPRSARRLPKSGKPDLGAGEGGPTGPLGVSEGRERGATVPDDGAPLSPPAAQGTLPRRGGRERSRPDQRRRLRQIADIVVREPEQHRVDPRLDEAADQRGLGLAKAQGSGHRGQRVATLRVRGPARSSPAAGGAWRCGAARRRGGREAGRSRSRRLLRRQRARPRRRRRSPACAAAWP